MRQAERDLYQFHHAVRVDFGLTHSAAELERYVQFVPGARTGEDVRLACINARAAGRNWVAPCDRSGPHGLCLGHLRVELTERDTYGT